MSSRSKPEVTETFEAFLARLIKDIAEPQRDQAQSAPIDEGTIIAIADAHGPSGLSDVVLRKDMHGDGVAELFWS